MPSFSSDASERARTQRAKEVHARLIARGLNPRSNGFSRAFHAAMRK